MVDSVYFVRHRFGIVSHCSVCACMCAYVRSNHLICVHTFLDQCIHKYFGHTYGIIDYLFLNTINFCHVFSARCRILRQSLITFANNFKFGFGLIIICPKKITSSAYVFDCGLRIETGKKQHQHRDKEQQEWFAVNVQNVLS